MKIQPQLSKHRMIIRLNNCWINIKMIDEGFSAIAFYKPTS
jgi:hypothetical protein